MLGYVSVFTNLGVIIFTTQRDFFGIDVRYDKLVTFMIIEVRQRIHSVIRPFALTALTRWSYRWRRTPCG